MAQKSIQPNQMDLNTPRTETIVPLSSISGDPSKVEPEPHLPREKAAKRARIASDAERDEHRPNKKRRKDKKKSTKKQLRRLVDIMTVIAEKDKACLEQYDEIEKRAKQIETQLVDARAMVRAETARRERLTAYTLFWTDVDPLWSDEQIYGNVKNVRWRWQGENGYELKTDEESEEDDELYATLQDVPKERPIESWKKVIKRSKRRRHPLQGLPKKTDAMHGTPDEISNKKRHRDALNNESQEHGDRQPEVDVKGKGRMMATSATDTLQETPEQVQVQGQTHLQESSDSPTQASTNHIPVTEQPSILHLHLDLKNKRKTKGKGKAY